MPELYGLVIHNSKVTINHNAEGDFLGRIVSFLHPSYLLTAFLNFLVQFPSYIGIISFLFKSCWKLLYPSCISTVLFLLLTIIVPFFKLVKFPSYIKVYNHTFLDPSHVWRKQMTKCTYCTFQNPKYLPIHPCRETSFYFPQIQSIQVQNWNRYGVLNFWATTTRFWKILDL